MMSPEQAVQSFLGHSAHARIAVIEGNRGLYDGVDHRGTYSTAELAKLLISPVIISVNCTKATNTIAAMILGCQKMDPRVLIKGVVLNRVANTRQESVIREAIQERCALPVLGAIPRLKKDPFPERHMGLTPFHEHRDIEESLALVRDIGNEYLDVESIMNIAERSDSVPRQKGKQFNREDIELSTTKNSLRIGVIKDSAFQFYYQENFEELQKRGAEIIEINAMKEKKLPDVDALYIGGGFPETHALALADNTLFKQSLHKAVEKGLPVYAECGGLMFLGRSLVLSGKTYPMADVLPITFSLEKRLQAHGYTTITVEGINPYFSQNSVFRGHEFHYSRVLEMRDDDIHMAFSVKRGKGIQENKDGICYKNVLATYTHLHALGTPEWADGLIKCAKESRDKT
jgi:cobyrinic acid a,c-diamide synthase